VLACRKVAPEPSQPGSRLHRAERATVSAGKRRAEPFTDGRAPARNRCVEREWDHVGSGKTVDADDDYLLALAQAHDADAVVAGEPAPAGRGLERRSGAHAARTGRPPRPCAYGLMADTALDG